MIQVIVCSEFKYCQWAFSRAFTTKVAPQCGAFSMALKIEKIKAPLLRSPKGAGDTKDCYNIATA